MNYFRGVPGKEQPELELTYNFGVDILAGGTSLTISNLAESPAKRRFSVEGHVRPPCAGLRQA